MCIHRQFLSFPPLRATAPRDARCHSHHFARLIALLTFGLALTLSGCNSLPIQGGRSTASASAGDIAANRGVSASQGGANIAAPSTPEYELQLDVALKSLPRSQSFDAPDTPETPDASYFVNSHGVYHLSGGKSGNTLVQQITVTLSPYDEFEGRLSYLNRLGVRSYTYAFKTDLLNPSLIGNKLRFTRSAPILLKVSPSSVTQDVEDLMRHDVTTCPEVFFALNIPSTASRQNPFMQFKK